MTMTTATISNKHELQLQLQLQQQQQQQQLLMQQQQQRQQQQQANTIFQLRNSNLNYPLNNPLTNTTTTTATTANIYDTKAATRFDGAIGAPAIAILTTATTTRTTIPIDSLNNNNNNHQSNLSVATTTTALTATTPTIPLSQSGLNTLNNNGAAGGGVAANDSPEAEPAQPKAQKRRSLLNFKSFDFHLKSLYTGLRNGHKPASQSQGCSPAAPGGVNGNGSVQLLGGPPLPAPALNNRIPPYLKIDAVDAEESENLLIDYPQSPYSSRRNSAHDGEADNRSSSQLLHINRYDMSRSPSPYYLSPHVAGSGNIRRSSTSDIVSCKRSGSSSASDSRRPSTSDLLRRARERRGSEARMGRSVSHSGLPRGGGFRGGGMGAGGRRTSMAF